MATIKWNAERLDLLLIYQMQGGTPGGHNVNLQYKEDELKTWKQDMAEYYERKWQERVQRNDYDLLVAMLELRDFHGEGSDSASEPAEILEPVAGRFDVEAQSCPDQVPGLTRGKGFMPGAWIEYSPTGDL